MIKMNVTTRVDYSGLKKLKRQLKRIYVDVGYIDSKAHWLSDVPVAQVASHLHYWSPWKDTFMLSDSKKGQVQSIVTSELNKLGSLSMEAIAKNVGEKAIKQIEVNIKAVSSPSNSESWAAVKGFNDPLIFGSRVGEEPNLISSLTFKVGV